ncbi:MAG: chaperone NapD [Sulfuricurvum sp.]|nr:chaperone NapD [Sulfuricurvum sp.]MDD5386122.1 chaperone NapD [Sulfuricurvum sp.]
MNISSIVVQTNPTYTEEVVEILKSADFCDYHFHDEKGRIIVTIEGEGVEEEIAKLVKIQEMAHIISADMSFAYSEDELNAERDKLEAVGDDLPSWLNDENATKRDIKYNGDLKDRF